MINIALSAVAALAVGLGISLAGFGVLAAVIPAALVFVGAFIVLARRTMTQFQAVATEAQKELQSISPGAKDAKNKIEKAITLLEGALALGRWQILLTSEIHAQIGAIHYVFGNLEKAEPALKQGSKRNGLGRAMLGALYFRNKQYPEMKAAFEEAVTASRKEGLLWAAYAWCLMQLKEKDAAIAVFVRAVEQNPSDEKLKGALEALQNDKKLKMKAWEPMWWQFGLETPPMQQPVLLGRQSRRGGFRR